MEYIVNQDNIQKYAGRLTQDLCRQFFVNKAFISGPEILTFNADRQLNLLLVKNIFLNWQKESLKLRSPYFDYEHAEVRKALKNFMDNLSNHIRVYRYDFEPLVARSVSDFILLAAAPLDFFTRETEALASPKVSVSLLKEFSKYIRINRFVMEQVTREIEASGYTETFAGETIRFIMKAVNENPDKLEVPENALKGLLEQLPAEVTDFVSVPKPLVTRPSFLDKPREAEEPQIRVSDVLAGDDHADAAAETAGEETAHPAAPVYAEEIQGQESETVPAVPDDSGEVIQFGEFIQPDGGEDISPVWPLAGSGREEAGVQDAGREPVTLNETLRRQESTRNLAEALQVKAPSAPFKTLVPMHYRFTFINALFAGNQQAWAEAVDKIDSAATYGEVIEWLNSRYSADYSWDKEEDNVAMLFDYIKRKF